MAASRKVKRERKEEERGEREVVAEGLVRLGKVASERVDVPGVSLIL